MPVIVSLYNGKSEQITAIKAQQETIFHKCPSLFRDLLCQLEMLGKIHAKEIGDFLNGYDFSNSRGDISVDSTEFNAKIVLKFLLRRIVPISCTTVLSAIPAPAKSVPCRAVGTNRGGVFANVVRRKRSAGTNWTRYTSIILIPNEGFAMQGETKEVREKEGQK